MRLSPLAQVSGPHTTRWIAAIGLLLLAATAEAADPAAPPPVMAAKDGGDGCFNDSDHARIEGTVTTATAKDANGKKQRLFVLDLAKPACFHFGVDADAGDATQTALLAGVDTIQLSFDNDILADAINTHLGRRIGLGGLFFAPQTPRHILPAIMRVDEVIAATDDAQPGTPSGTKPGSTAPGPTSSGPTSSGKTGTPTQAIATARAFFDALSRGDGAAASQLVVPEARATGPLSAATLSAFYGALRQPLQVQALVASSATRVTVAFDWESDSKVCEGLADVTLVARDEGVLIQAVKTGC